MFGMADLKPSRSSRALQQILEGDDEAAAVYATGIHRTQLWKYSTGRGKPDADGVAKLHRATGGKVAADGWETEEAESKGAVE